MHAPRPYGLFHKAPLNQEDQQAIESLTRTLSNYRELSKLDSLKRSITLSDGRVATAIDMGGLFRVLVSDPYAAPDYEFDGTAHDYIPMLFSGSLKNGLVKANEGMGIRLTEICRRRLAHYTQNLPSKDQSLQRFVIEYPTHLQHLKLKNTGIYTQTQYHKMRPQWHSSTMAQVVQVVSGYGKQTLEELPESPVERAQFILPTAIKDQIQKELAKARLPAYTGFPNPKGELNYNYRANQSHAVAQDPSGNKWLLQISEKGVYVMPLPLIPATTTQAFRQYIEQVQDTEILHLLNTFGGMPSGETFPSEQDFAAWERTGCLIKICHTSDFYQHSPIYEACGWSFNSTGSEGFNTCFEYSADGMMHAHAYKLSLRLKTAQNHGWQYDIRQEWTTDQTTHISRYLAALLGSLKNDTQGLTIRYKIRRSTAEQLSDRAVGMQHIEEEIQYWDTLVMPPIANHTGNVTKVSTGKVYHNSLLIPALAELKFPTLNGEGCQSFAHDISQYIKNGGKPQRCDTIMFGCYIDDQLQVVKYFYDDRPFIQIEHSTYIEPMIIGQWEKTTTQGQSGLIGHFYTTQFDDRQAAAPVVTHTTVIGKDLGYGKPLYQTPPLISRVGTVSRYRYYSTTTKTHRSENFSLKVGICIPVFSRDCIQYAYKDWASSESTSETAERHSIKDPYSYQMWTYDSAYHFRDSTINGNQGMPYPKDGKPVYVDSEIYTPNETNDYANSGSWMSTIADITGIVGQYTARNNNKPADGVSIGGEAPPFASYRKQSQQKNIQTGKLNISAPVAKHQTVHKDQPQEWFFTVSPIETNGELSYFYRDTGQNNCGERPYFNINELKTPKQRCHWGNTQLSDHNSSPYFIGVINE
ncbi:hypothetical protein [Kingella negevensis]|uniref:hypothetical protein n=1 Tax=Kingella negevensis TaxID=1522312 RepID=UPI00050A33FC|nr:hypothetical protein [Kingella negevensis]